MEPRPRSTGTRGWSVAGALLAALGGLTCLFKAASFLTAAPGTGPAGSWSAVMGALGVAALGAAALVGRRPGLAAGAMAALGVAVLLLDLSGLGAPPRMLAGLALLGGAVLAVAGTASAAGGKVPVPARVAVWVGLAVHAVLGVLLLPLGLVAPGWAVLALLLVWAALLGVALRARSSRPWLVPAAPAAMFLVAAATLAAGESLLGWSP